MGFWTCAGKKDFCKEFERESLILAYTKRRKINCLVIFISCFSIVIKGEVLFLSEAMPYGNRTWNIRRIHVIRDLEYTLILRRKKRSSVTRFNVRPCG